MTCNRLTNSSYTLKFDFQSMGVILYILLSGTPPFSLGQKLQSQLQIPDTWCQLCFYPELFDNISSHAKDLIIKLLKVKPVERMLADDILKHP